MTIQDKLAALEPMHKEGRYVGVYGQLEPADYQTRIDALSARLRLCAEVLSVWIEFQDVPIAEFIQTEHDARALLARLRDEGLISGGS